MPVINTITENQIINPELLNSPKELMFMPLSNNMTNKQTQHTGETSAQSSVSDSLQLEMSMIYSSLVVAHLQYWNTNGKPL